MGEFCHGALRGSLANSAHSLVVNGLVQGSKAGWVHISCVKEGGLWRVPKKTSNYILLFLTS